MLVNNVFNLNYLKQALFGFGAKTIIPLIGIASFINGRLPCRQVEPKLIPKSLLLRQIKLAHKAEPQNRLTICQKDSPSEVNEVDTQKTYPNSKIRCHCTYSRHSLVLVKNWQHHRQVCSRRAPFFQRPFPYETPQTKTLPPYKPAVELMSYGSKFKVEIRL